MASTLDIKGTSQTSFTIAKGGITLTSGVDAQSSKQLTINSIVRLNEIRSIGALGIGPDIASGSLFINNSGSNSGAIQILSGKVGIFNNSPTASLDVVGTIKASSTITGSNLSGTNTGDQTITLTGDITGSGAGSFATTLANTSVTPGSYSNPTLQIDSKGRITSASSGVTPSTNFFANITDGTNTASSASNGTFRLRSANSKLSIAVSNDDVSFGDNALFTINESSLALNNIGGTLETSKGGTGVTNTPTNGQLLIGNGSGYTLANLTAGTGISITNTAGAITVNGPSLTNYVTLDGVQTISGTKTFSSLTNINNNLTINTSIGGALLFGPNTAGQPITTGLPTMAAGPPDGAKITLLNVNQYNNTQGSYSIGLDHDTANSKATMWFSLAGISSPYRFAWYAGGNQIATLTAAGLFTPSGGTSGAWNGNTISISRGGTGVTNTPTDGQLLIGNGSGYTLANLTAGTGISIANSAGNITISSTNSSDAYLLNRTNHTGTQTFSTITGTVPTSQGGTGLSSTPTNGQIPIGNGTDYTLANLSAGTGISITNTAGGITIDSTASSNRFSYIKPGVYYNALSPRLGYNTTSTTAIVAGTIPVYPFIAEYTGTINNIAVYVQAIGASTTSIIRFTIYDNIVNATNNYPNNRLNNASTASFNTAGIKNATINQTVTQGQLYWVAVNLYNTAGTAAHTFRAGFMSEPWLGLSTTFTTNNQWDITSVSTTTASTATTTATFPTTGTSYNSSSTTVPVIGITYS